MLTFLHIDNFALIERVDIELGPGLNVITGETGAGKSILIGALDSILGGTANADLIRSGADSCAVEGLFEIAPDSRVAARLAALGVALEDDQLILRREIRRRGRSRAFINGRLLPARQLRQVGGLLVDLHGQHEHQSLLDTATHVRVLDESGGLRERSEQVAHDYGAMARGESELAELRTEREALVAEEELRQYQLEEMQRLAPQSGEDEALEREVRVLENQEELAQASQEIYDLLYGGEGSTVEQLGRARRQLEHLAEVDGELASRTEALTGLLYAVEDLAGDLRAYGQSLEADPQRLAEARQRLEELRLLIRRHGGSLDDVLAASRDLAQREERSGDLDGQIAAAQGRLGQMRDAFGSLCQQLSRERGEAAVSLASAVKEAQKRLGMPHAAIQVSAARQEDPDGAVELDGRRFRADATGVETIEFCISANAGEPPLPLATVASGGEISRIMLVLKSFMAERDPVVTLVFDEIDVGISGRIAAAVGKQLAALSSSHQTLVITHLPQIAGLANHHYSVRKTERGGRTSTEVHKLGEAERAEEIALLLAGETVSDAARRHARELLE